MRLAWFTPLPPVPSGIADYSVEILPRLGATHQLDVFVASTAEQGSAPAGVVVCDAHAFPPRQHRDPYDLVVYQLGNAWCHDYMWPYVFRYPGLVVLHDAHLHHARAWSLLGRHRQEDYRAELRFNEPAAEAAAAEIGLSGFAGLVYYFWPMLRTVVISARAVAVHNTRVGAVLADAYPAAAVETIRMGVADPRRIDRADARAAIRARHDIPADAMIALAFGGVTPEKRIVPLLRAAASARAYCPALHVVLVGRPSPDLDPASAAAAIGMAGHVSVAGFVPDGEVPAYLAAADMAVCLRWPSARETSASWLRAAAAGLPTIVPDLVHQADLPTLDPRTWTVHHVEPSLSAPAPVAISVDILDEEHSLALALRRLSTDADLRASVGRRGRDYWLGDHTLDHMEADYLDLLDRTRTRPAPVADLPSHVRPDPLTHARALVEAFGVELGLD